MFEEKEARNIEDYDEIDDLEADFYNLNQTHKQYEAERARHKDMIVSKIIGQKYFSVKLPNFLTWSEKEQIRHLINDNSEEWDLQRLSDSFPASRETIAKIIKAKWSPKSAERIEKHDQEVEKNWKLLRDGKLTDLPQDLVQHLKKFTNRKCIPLQTDKFIKHTGKFEKPAKTEFSSIITSCKAYKDKQEDTNLLEGSQVNINREIDAPVESEPYTFVMNQKTDKIAEGMKESITLSELMKRTQIGAAKSVQFVPENPSGTGIVEAENPVEIFKFKKAKNELVDAAKLNQPAEPEIPDYIKIPQKLYRKGATYKVKDCYYDDDGEFLYRVPGLK
jgi:hypothetical protein